MSESPESIEVQVERIRRTAGGLSDYHLDEYLAVAAARRNVAAAHGMTTAADAFQELTLALDDVRRMRADAAREIASLTGPPEPLTRPLTPEELSEE